MGGLAGIPFGGLTSFGAMAAHIPDGGSCVVVYGPHVGVDSLGTVGTVERAGRVSGGACCGSAAAACGHVCQQVGQNSPPPSAGVPTPATIETCLDAQQASVGSLLLPYANRLVASKTTSAEAQAVELPNALFQIQQQLMEQIILQHGGASKVSPSGNVALIGGIQINTPSGMEDYFLPLQLDVYDNTGAKVAENLLSEILE